jgi:4-alpha-glucanotransferase
MKVSRSCGILLHPTSLPGPYGVGDLGPAADAFVDFLVETGQSWWQVLPLGPIGPGNSPYQSSSSFAGNPLLISPEQMRADGLITRKDLAAYPRLPEGHASYAQAAVAKEALLRRAYARWPKKSPELDAFRERHARWLDDYALYAVLKRAQEGRVWNRWEPKLARRDPASLERAREAHAGEVRFIEFVQYVFDRQWRRLREVGERAGVRLIGDLPIYVSDDGADVWARPDLFLLGKGGRLEVVAGVPPDDFSKSGQRWGNPLYDWEANRRDGFRWWVERIKGTLDRVDLVRLDHFLGVVKYYKVPGKYRTARVYERAQGPGATFLDAVRAALPKMPIIAEDLGLVDAEARRLRDDYGLPGMRVFQFLNFEEAGLSGEHLPDNYVEDCVAYTGTHDNDTTIGWYRSLKKKRKALLLQYLGLDGTSVNWDVIARVFRTDAKLAIVPIQDVLGLDSSGRMNVPGRHGNYWSWRLRPGALDDVVRARLAAMTKQHGRARRRPSQRRGRPT